MAYLFMVPLCAPIQNDAVPEHTGIYPYRSSWLTVAMLTYLSSGSRRYDQLPVPLHIRRVWEFQAVLKGSISPVLPGGEEPPAERSLFCFRPDAPHGWSAPAEQRSQIVVFHFSSVAPEFARTFADRTSLCVSLEANDVTTLRELFRDAVADISRPGLPSVLHSRILADRLALLMTKELADATFATAEHYGRSVVDRAESLYRAEMHLGIDANQIAERLGLSTSHLRRLFHKVAGRSPRESFSELRMERALELCTSTGRTMLEIAMDCGFADQSSLTRAFRHRWGQSPLRARGIAAQATRIDRSRP